MSNLIEHAKAELKALGYTPLDTQQEDGPDKWIQQNVLELIQVFADQGHSGGSAPYCVKIFEKLAMFNPLTPIKCTDEEWMEVEKDQGAFQNKRLSSVFKEGKEGFPYYLDAIIWKNEKGTTYGGSALDKDGKVITSRQFINLPFTPKNFVVDVIETEIKPGDFEFVVKDESQLKEVFEYYNRYEKPTEEVS